MSGSPDAARGPLHPEPAGTDTNARPNIEVGGCGDRVRVVLEGVRDAGSHAFWIGDQQRGHANLIAPDAAHVISIEVLPPPEPTYKVGDVAACEHGWSFLRGGQGKWIGLTGEERKSTCDLTLLVRDGKPVA